MGDQSIYRAPPHFATRRGPKIKVRTSPRELLIAWAGENSSERLGLVVYIINEKLTQFIAFLSLFVIPSLELLRLCFISLFLLPFVLFQEAKRSKFELLHTQLGCHVHRKVPASPMIIKKILLFPEKRAFWSWLAHPSQRSRQLASTYHVRVDCNE